MVQRPPRSSRILALALFLICGSTYLLFHFGINDQLRLSLGGANHSSGNSQSSSPPSITIIAIWNPKSSEPPPQYLPNFFASIRANPKVHLLFVVFDKFYFGCDKRISPVEENIREICFDIETYWSLHVDFLCEHWGCADEDKSPLLQTLARRGNNDATNSYFRPFRAGIFAKWIDPLTPIWGWCEMDIMLGNFDRQFPWDVAGHFDLIIPAAIANTDQVMLFMPSHLMFFRHDKRVTNEFFNFPALRSMQSFLGAPEEWINIDAEEADYSHFAILNGTLTFMHFSAVVWTSDHLSTVGDGVYSIDHAYLDPPQYPSSNPDPSDAAAREYISYLVTSSRTWVPPPTFSSQGMEYAVKVYGGKYAGDPWFSPELVVHYEPDYNEEVYKNIRRDTGKRYVMRRAINGPVTERVEPPYNIITRPLDDLEGTKGIYTHDNRPLLTEYLYVDYQAEKHRKWWDLPNRPLKEGEILYMNAENGAQAWDETGEPWWTRWATIETTPSDAQS